MSDGTTGAGVAPAGFLRTTDEPTTIFYDPFDAALDTTNYWTTPTVGNSAVLATVTAGIVALGTGTTASGWSKLFSQASFKLQIPGWTGYSFALAIPDLAAPTANAYRFWGSGTPATTPTTAAPMTNAIGFELATDGKMYAVVYAAGTRTVIQDLSAATGNSKQPTDANPHRYIVQVRTDRSYFYIDGVTASTLVATANFQSPQIQTLPMSFVAVGGATPPASNAQIQCWGAAVWDTSKSSMSISDPDYAWRQAAVQATVPTGTEMGLVVRQAAGIKSAVVQTATSNLTASGQAQTITLQGEAAMAVQLSGTWVGTATFEASNDNTNWSTINVQRAGDNVISQTVVNSTNNDLYRIGVAGFLYVRIRCSAYTSGTIVVTTATSLAASTAILTASLPAGTADIGGFVIGQRQQWVGPTAVPGVATGAYAIGNQFGTLITLTNSARATGGGGFVTSLIFSDADALITALDVYFFHDTVTLAADKAAFSLSDADTDKILWIARCTYFEALPLNRINTQNVGISVPYFCTGTSLYAAVRIQTAYTLAATASPKYKIAVTRD